MDFLQALGVSKELSALQQARLLAGRVKLTTCSWQIMGPGDSYLLQYAKPACPFWASPADLALGACFLAKRGTAHTYPTTMLSEVGPNTFDAARGL